MIFSELFWKIFPVITGVAGYVGGIFSDSIKEWIVRRRLRKALYIELGWMYSRLAFLEKTYRREPLEESSFPTSLVVIANILISLRFDCFESAKKEPMKFMLLKDFSEIEDAYQGLTSLKIVKGYNRNLDGYTHLKDVLVALDRFVREKKLDRKLLMQINEPEFKTYIRNL